MRARRRPAPVAVLLLLLGVVAAACSGGGTADAPTTTAPPEPTTTEASTTTTTLAPVYPLTGRPVTDPEVAARPVVAVKIDNIAAARPQAGVAAADVVYEEFTEGVTRFVVVYHSTDAEVVGPVRSVRPADPVIVTPLGGVLGFSGGSPGAVALAATAPVALVTESDTAVMYRRPGRAAPHNLYTSTSALYSRVPAGAGSPGKLADFLRDGQTFTGPGATPVSTLHLVPAPYVTADYTWEPGAGVWLRTTDGFAHRIEEGRIAPTTVILQFAPYVFFIDDYDVRYPEVVGTGDLWVFAAGQLVKGTWSKASAESMTTFSDSEGKPIVLPPGQTWIHLIEPGSTVIPG